MRRRGRGHLRTCRREGSRRAGVPRADLGRISGGSRSLGRLDELLPEGRAQVKEDMLDRAIEDKRRGVARLQPGHHLRGAFSTLLLPRLLLLMLLWLLLLLSRACARSDAGSATCERACSERYCTWMRSAVSLAWST